MIVHFVDEVPILGTSKRRADFDPRDGWEVRVTHEGDVLISRPASENVPAIPCFRVHGVGYSREEKPGERHAEPKTLPGVGPGADGAVVDRVPGPEAPPADPQPAEGEPPPVARRRKR